MVEIEYVRPGKGLSIYKNQLVWLNEIGLKSQVTLEPDHAKRLTGIMQRDGWIRAGRTVHSLVSYFFFNEGFDIVLWFDQLGDLIGFYTDITTPLQRTETGFTATDLFLDIWISPTGELTELDWDEFEEACEQAIITPDLIESARTTMQKVVDLAASGEFPFNYIEEQHLRWS